MRHAAVAALSVLLAVACSERKQPAATDASQPQFMGQMPTTQPAAVQRVITEEATIANAQLSAARGGPAMGVREERLRPVALFYGTMPTGFSFSENGRLFAAFPRWGDPVNFTVGEIRENQLVPFPDARTNEFYPSDPQRLDPRTHLVSVQSVVMDNTNRLWLLDTGSVNMNPVIPGGPKLWGYDLRTNQRVKEITFEGSIRPNTYLNDVRFHLAKGDQGFAYITDSGAGGIIVVDLASGQSWRKLDGHPSVMPDRGITLMVEGQPMMKRPPGTNREEPALIASDGIALSPDGQTLYYTPLTSRSIYSVPTQALRDRNLSAYEVNSAVVKLADKPSANDGIFCDPQGRIYTADFEDNAIRRITPAPDGRSATSEVIVQDSRLLWPDCVWIHEGDLYVTANQLHRQPQYHRGNDLRDGPYVLFRYAGARE